MRTPPPTPTYEQVLPVLRRLVGEPVAATPVREGGYSPTGRWVVRLADGTSAFVKAELHYGDAHGTGVEHLVYSAVAAPWLPALVAYDPGGDGAPRVLVTEDLSGATWGTPLTADDAAMLRDALDAVALVAAPDGLHPVVLRPRWADLATNPDAVVGTGLLDAAWLDRHAPALVAAESAVATAGDRLVHCDMWLQNWCRVPGRGAIVVDWAGAASGEPLVMRALAEAGVRAAAGPRGIVLAPGNAAWAAWVAGQTAFYLTEVEYVRTERLEETERREALACLRWACDELGLPYPALRPPFTDLGPWRP